MHTTGLVASAEKWWGGTASSTQKESDGESHDFLLPCIPNRLVGGSGKGELEVGGAGCPRVMVARTKLRDGCQLGGCQG